MDTDTEIDRIKKQALEIKEKIESGSLLERISILDEYYKKWIIKPDSRNTMFDYLNLALHNFGLDPDNLQIGTFERAKKVVKFELQYLNLQFMQDDEVLEDFEMKSDIESKINKISKALVDADNAIQSTLYLKSSMTQEDIGHELKQDIFRFSEINYEDNIPYQNLLLYLMEKLKRNKYRRYVQESKGMCYQSIYTEDGFETHAWKPAMTVKEFIHDETRKDFNFAMWQNATAAKDNVKAATTYLTEFLGGEFEDLKRDRHVFSFKNGIYFTKTEDSEGNLKDQFVPYTGPKSKKIGASVVACKYFNQDFVDYTHNEEAGYKDWFDIIKNHCPNIKHVMEYQEWPEDVQRWLFILIGRMFYNVGELDDWQCLPYLLGQAGTGKSSILMHIIKLMYEPADIGILSNNMEKKFGLGALANKLIFIGPEIKGDLSLEQSEFQSIISGEDVQLNIKNQLAYSKKWDVPGMVAGNVVPQYTDNAGSIARRIVVFPFDKKVKKGEGDSKLGKKLESEVVPIIQAANKAYLEALEEHGSKDIWSILPEKFRETKEQMAENTNGLTHFLNSEEVKLGKDLYVREKIFIIAFNEHCREHNLGAYKWSSQFFSGPFADAGITVNKNTYRKYPNNEHGQVYGGRFIFGIDIANLEKVKSSVSEEDLL